MPRILDRKVVAVSLGATLTILTSCASPHPPATAHVQGSPADPCRKYESPTEFGRCRLFMSADGWQFIPEIGRNADLDTQIRCAPVRPDLDVYAECIRRARVLATPLPAAPAAGPVSQVPIRVEPITPDVAVARPSPEPRNSAKSAPVRLHQPAVAPVSDDAIRQRLVQQSIAGYSGSCPCPYNIDSGGRSCGGRSAYFRSGGASPYCFASDVPASSIEAYRRRAPR
jgi:hypothetical protein